MHHTRRAVLTLALAWLLIVAQATAAVAQGLFVYSARKEELIRPAIQAAEKTLGVKMTLFTAGAGELARRIELERANPRGDVFIGTTAGFAELMREKGLLGNFTSPVLKEIPGDFRSPDNTWVPLTARVRVLVYNTNFVKPPDIPKSYFDLTDPKWKGKVTVASMAERTTAAWVASILALKGEDFTRRYVEGLGANGLKVLQNNTDVRRAVASGEYAVGITNHYYFMLQMQDNPQSPIGIVYPDQGPGDLGTPVFAITAAVIKGAKNAETARTFLEYLLGSEGNRYLVDGEFEIPLLPGLRSPGGDRGIRALGQFKRPPLSQAQMAAWETRAERLFGSRFTP